ncbi:MAG: hypothetical protein M3Z06_00525 [Actinomycetota bacterium]|nr:hypothetical protein [Actinomycetota bacterium]
MWTDRLREADAQRYTILAENEGLVGFANIFLEDDSRWGALLDNLHVAADTNGVASARGCWH